MVYSRSGTNPTGKRLGQAAVQPDPSNTISVGTKKKRKKKSVHPTVLSTAMGNLINLATTAVTSGSVLLCLFAAKRLL
jgi:hypothetical protein